MLPDPGSFQEHLLHLAEINITPYAITAEKHTWYHDKVDFPGKAKPTTTQTK
jgi:hypothetical protein